MRPRRCTARPRHLPTFGAGVSNARPRPAALGRTGGEALASASSPRRRHGLRCRPLRRRRRSGARRGKPMMQVAAFDGRDCLGGLISVRLLENSWSACAGCYLDPNRNWSPAGTLLSTVTSALAALAANMAVAILSGVHTQVFREKNLFYVDLETYAIEALAVQKRDGCPLCGKSTEMSND